MTYESFQKSNAEFGVRWADKFIALQSDDLAAAESDGGELEQDHMREVFGIASRAKELFTKALTTADYEEARELIEQGTALLFKFERAYDLAKGARRFERKEP